MSRNSADLIQSSHHPLHVLNGQYSTHFRQLQRSPGPVGEAPSVAVIGAGVAGLRCADVLLRSGFNVTIFEARDRIGGRVHQVTSAGYLMDLGPNWVHGDTCENPISRIARKTKTVLHERDGRQIVIDSDGNKMRTEDVETYSQIVWDTLAKAFRYSDENSDSIDPNKSLMDYFREEIPKRTSNTREISEILKMAQRWGAFVGDPIERQSLKFFFLEETIDGGTPFVASTYRGILADIARNPLEHAEVHFNTEVDRIQASATGTADQGACQNLCYPHSLVKVCTTSGIERGFNEVIMTAPLGWLKANKKAFEPPLLDRISQAIDNISYGRLEKVYVTFPRAFWHGMEDDGDCEEYPGCIHFQSPSYVPHPPSVSWNQYLVSLSALPAPYAHPTLLFYVYGPCATALVDSIAPHPPTSTEYYATLNSFFAPFYSKLPNFDPASLDCTPLAFLATQWQKDKFAGNGSYTNFQIGLGEGDVDIEVMREGMPERGIWLAGEHTAPFVALATTTGAYWAGEGVARRICAAYGRSVPEDAVDGEGLNETEKKVANRGADAVDLNGFPL